MIGILYYIYFLILGFLYSKYIFNKNIYFHIWIGGVIGNIILMTGIIIPSFIFGFTILSHTILLVLASIPLFILFKIKGLPSFKYKTSNKDAITNKIFLFLIIPIFLIMAILLTNHTLVTSSSGDITTGQSTYSDLSMHIGFITSIKEQQDFPPDYVLLSNTKLNYPFLVDSLSSSLYSMNTSLRLSILVPSYVMCLLLVMGFYYLAYKITENRKVSILACVFFFIGGGLGFIYFFDGLKTSITELFTSQFRTPTDYIHNNIVWSNPICGMIIAQRSTMAGWLILMPSLYFLIDGCKNNRRKSFIILGLIASSLPMINAHSFLALGIISIGMFVCYFIKSKEKKKIFKNWFIYGLIVLLLAFPQLFIWTFKQTIGNSEFVKFQFNWFNLNDTYIWFYIKNWGLVFIFIIPAFLLANKDNKCLILSALLLFVIAELIVFQPNPYDNNKILFPVYMLFLINCCNWYMYIFNKLKKVPGRYFLLIIVILLSTLSGILSIAREMQSAGEFKTFTKDMVEMSEYIKKETDTKALFLTSTSHINPVSSLAGRNIYVGPAIYLFGHGFAEEYHKRNREIENALSSDYDSLISFCNEKNINYIYIGTNEKNEYTINWDTINKLKKVIKYGDEELYEVG